MLVKKYQNNLIDFIALVSHKENLPRFLRKYRFNYLQGYSDTDMSSLFGILYPRHIIIDRTGKIIYNAVGGSKNINKRLDDIIKSIL